MPDDQSYQIPLLDQEQDLSTLPLQLARAWDFSLNFRSEEDGYWYSPHDWLTAFIGRQHASQVWRNNLRTRKYPIIYRTRVAHDGKRYRFSFVSEKTLYNLVLQLRYNTPQVVAFKEYLVSIALVSSIAALDFELENGIDEAKSALFSCETEYRVQPRKGYIYFVKSISGHYKIGKTKNIKSRMHTFGVKLPFEVTLEMVIETDDMVQAERLLHRHFADKRVNGEWFAIDGEHLREVSNILQIHHVTGKPLLAARIE